MIFGGLWSIFIVPLIFQATKTIVKRCYDCSNVIQRHNLFSFPSLSDQILNFRFGNCAFILSRKYAYIIVSIFLLIFAYRLVFVAPQEQLALKEQDKVTRTWENFAYDCGRTTYLRNAVRAKHKFLKFYKKKSIVWTGAFIDAPK